MNVNGPILGRIVSWLVALLCIIAFLFPLRLWLYLGRLTGVAAYHLLRNHRRFASRNIKHVYGESLSEGEVSGLIKQNFKVLAMSAFEWLKSPSYRFTGLAPLLKRITVEGKEHLDEVTSSGKGILLLNAHFGLLDIPNVMYTHLTGRTLNFILRRFDNPHLQNVLFGHNDHFQIKLFSKETGLRPVIKNLLKGEDLIIFPDQASNLKEGVNSTIFGKDAITLSILPALALKLNSPILPMFLFRQEDPTKHKLIFFPPIFPSEHDTIDSLAQKQNDAIEKAVRMQPDHWLWLHRRWKEELPEMYK